MYASMCSTAPLKRYVILFLIAIVIDSNLYLAYIAKRHKVSEVKAHTKHFTFDSKWCRWLISIAFINCPLRLLRNAARMDPCTTAGAVKDNTTQIRLKHNEPYTYVYLYTQGGNSLVIVQK
uniref:Uncharacterized protein n=1 Tax=Glossina pallidipes TaxID=7398 RepID=A0A1A9ZBW3_GLOPL